MGHPVLCFAIRVLSIFGLLLFLSGAANAYCSEPYAPDPPGIYSKPDVPYCLNEYSYSDKHSCERYEIDGYFSEVDEYIEKLKAYVSEASTYFDDVVAYAKCERDDVVEQHK